MKGTIVATWVRTARKLWGENLVSEVLRQIGYGSDHVFLPTEDIEDHIPQKMIHLISQKISLPISDVWHAIGKDNIKTFFEAYPAFFRDPVDGAYPYNLLQWSAAYSYRLWG